MKVYVIKKGMYSDRHIIGVVESEEEAKKNAIEAWNRRAKDESHESHESQNK